ncbi:DUF4301 family protein [Zunongwangia endophytica]|uniref:DUF4301 family protein n=1 Tax=Zunongwangia endophytica TaxID=1808945 RepID=A0ABV8H487_9FLAO|nr:DUF4301 family protein [Zunongwangia endophytica]MDN3595607.1 DUF4301 family protein [Zunongwangia endophytica]
MKFNESDLLQIQDKGLTTEEVERQIAIFERGNIKVDIQEAATIGNGISEISDEQRTKYIKDFEHKKDELDLLKFVPASGAATRMFKALHNFVSDFDPDKEELRDYLDKKGDSSLQLFFNSIENLPFYKDAIEKAKADHDHFDDLSNDAQKKIIAENVLYSKGLGLSDLPKGLVPFHKYDDIVVTAFEEHLYEAAKYADSKGLVKSHFTVGQGDKEKFEAEFNKIKQRVEEKTNLKFEISYSYQDPKTDTIAVDDENAPFRTEEGKMFFRPGGHGALIDNLNQQDADLIFVKNIDNVVTWDNLGDVVDYKKMLAGKLLELRDKTFGLISKLQGNPSDEDLKAASDFLMNQLFVKSLTGSESASELIEKLDRPLRIGGMVKNEGEPGGGPFLVKDEEDEISLQIIEGAQIDEDNPEQVKIVNDSTHFNPVDIVCSVKKPDGNTYDLEKFVDPNMSFVANKTKDGKPLKALERPGLWNGAMAKWNTVFVEVPVTTFNPVKTVADLLKESHQTAE